MPVAVVVELPPVDKSSPFGSALIDTCNIGMRPRGSCILAQDASPSDRDVPVAIVTWDGTARAEVRIEVGVRVGGKSNWLARVVSFSSADPEIERWRSAGFAVATLVGEAVTRGEAESKEEGSPSPPPSRRQPPAGSPSDTIVAARTSTNPTEANEAAAPRSWLDGQYMIASGAEGLAPAQGAMIRFSRIVDDDNRWFVTGAVHFCAQSVDPDRITIMRSGASAAAGFVALRLTQHANFALRAGAVVEFIEATGTDAVTGTSGSGGRLVAGLTQGVDAVWMWAPSVGLVAGADLSETIGPTEIRSHGRLMARVPAVDLAAEGGLRVAFP